MSTKSLPATLAQFQAMRDLAIPYDADHPPTFDEAAKLLSEKIRGTPADRSEGWPAPSSSPIDDLREAVRPRPLRPEALVVGPAQAVNIRRALGGDINHARDDDDRADFDRRYPVHPAQGVVNDESVTIDPKTQSALSKGLPPLAKSNREILEAAFRSYRKDARPDAQEGEDDAAWLHFFEHVRKAEEAERPLHEITYPPPVIGEGVGAQQRALEFIAAKAAPGHEPPTVVWTKPDDGPVVFRTYGFAVRRPPWPRTLDPNKSYPIDSLEGRQAIGANPPASVDLTEPHVATLPDGRAVDLPAGTVLREGMTWDGPPADPLRDLCDAFKANPDPATAAMISKLREQVDRGASPLLAQALDLLRRARPCLAALVRQFTAAADPERLMLSEVAMLSEIDAFLAGMPIVSEGSR